ncbi:MAG TPA: hypothetical protein VD995_16980 [Azospirillum sp.]|nr:hypothetical protein [Azospirillum sp.]
MARLKWSRRAAASRPPTMASTSPVSLSATSAHSASPMRAALRFSTASSVRTAATCRSRSSVVRTVKVGPGPVVSLPSSASLP